MLAVVGREAAAGELLAELDAKEIKARFDQAVTRAGASAVGGPSGMRA